MSLDGLFAYPHCETRHSMLYWNSHDCLDLPQVLSTESFPGNQGHV